MEYEKNGPGKLIQVGIVVRDIFQSVKDYERLLQAHSDEIVEYPSGIYVAHLYLPDISTQIELLSPTREDNLWAEHLKEIGEGLHHLCFDVDNYEQTCQDFQQRNIRCLRQNQNSQDKRIRYALFDTRELGFITEIVNRAEVAAMDQTSVNKKKTGDANGLAEKMERLKRFSTADIADTMYKRFGLKQFSVVDMPPLRLGEVFAGPAVTLSYRKTGRGDKVLPFYETVRAHCYPGAFVVMEGRGPDYIYGGDVVCRYLRHCGAVGLLTDGRMRDIQELSNLDMTVCCCGSGTYIPHYAGEIIAAQQPLEFRGTRINPGDIIFGDRDGIVVIPGELLDEVLYQAEDIVRIEQEYTQVFQQAAPGENIAGHLRTVGSQKAVKHL